jgi:hypothetical protein
MNDFVFGSPFYCDCFELSLTYEWITNGSSYTNECVPVASWVLEAISPVKRQPGCRVNHSQSYNTKSYVTTDGQSASLSCNKAPIWGLRPDFHYRRTVAGLFMWDALSGERPDLSFTIAVGPRRRSHSRVLVPWDLRPYFTVSDSRLHFSSPPTTRRVTVEVFNPACTRNTNAFCQSQSHFTTDSQSVCLSVLVSSPVWGSWPDIYFDWKLQSCPYGSQAFDDYERSRPPESYLECVLLTWTAAYII